MGELRGTHQRSEGGGVVAARSPSEGAAGGCPCREAKTGAMGGCALLLTALLLGCAPTWSAGADGSLHVVERGETLTGIAARHGITWRALADANRIGDPDSIRPGQRLRIPAAAGGRARSPEQQHTVVRGDTVWGLAHRYGVSVGQVLAANDLTSSSVLAVGQVLTIPAGSTAVSSRAAVDAGWARQLKPRAKLRRWRYIVIHHSATREGTVEAMDAYHRRTRHMAHGLAYHFVIGNGRGMRDGELEIGSRWTWQLQGGHVRSASLNEQAIGICLVGDFEDHHPSRRQMTTLTQLVRALQQQTRIPASRVLLHRDLRSQSTLCPGALFPAAELKRRILP